MVLDPLRSHYLLAYAVFGIVQPYAPLLLKDAGLTQNEIGWVIALFGVSVFITPPLLSALADLHLQPRRLIAGIFLVMSFGLALFAQAEGLVFAAVGYALVALCITPTFPVSDALHFRVEAERPADVPETPFHRIRVYGAYGFILPAVPLAIFLPDGGLGSRLAMVFGIVVCLLTILNTRRLPTVRHEVATGSLAAFPTWTAASRLLRPDARWFCLAVLLFSCSLSAYYGFYPLHLRELGVGDRYIALIVALGVIAEVFCTLTFGWLRSRIGLRGVVILGAGALCVRLLLLYAVPTAAAAIVSQLFHGPAMLLLVIAVPVFLNQLAGRTDRTSIQGVFAFMVFGLGRTLGPIVPGFVPDNNLSTVFAMGMTLSGIATLILVLGFREPSDQTRPVESAMPAASPRP